MRFSATEAAFEGFRLVRRDPKVLLFWGLLYLLVTVGQLVMMYLHREQIAVGLAAMEALATRKMTTPEDLTAFLEAYNQAASYGIWLLPLSLVVGAVMSAGIARAVLFPEEKSRFGYLRLGADEVRVLIVSLCIALLAGVAMGAAFFVLVMLIAAAAVMPVLWLAVFVAFLGVIALFVWLAVKWCLAIPITMTRKKLAIFDSFAATKGHFWPLLGMAIVSGVMGILIWLLSMVVVMPLSLLSGAGPMGGATDELMNQLAAANPLLLLTAVANAIVYALMVGIVYAPFAGAWRDIKALTPSA
jgi:hypothetical protein